jgi:hypothetical protein
MNGLKYTLFVQELPLKWVAGVLKVSVSAVNDWASGRKPIPDKRKEALSGLLGVSSGYLDKPLGIEDKLEIELQLNRMDRDELSAEAKFLEVVKQNTTIINRYKDLLNDFNQQTNQFYELVEKIETLNKSLSKLTLVESLVNDPEGYSVVLNALSDIQHVRRLTKR